MQDPYLKHMRETQAVPEEETKIQHNRKAETKKGIQLPHFCMK